MTQISRRQALQDMEPGEPLTDDQMTDVRLTAAQMVLRAVDGNEGGEALAEKCWNTIMDIACGSQTERKPFDRDDRDILAAARTVAPAAILTSGELANNDGCCVSCGDVLVSPNTNGVCPNCGQPILANDAYGQSDHAITTLQQLADAREASFNRHYYGNTDGKAEFVQR